VILACHLQISGLKRAHVNLHRQISFTDKSAQMASWASGLVSRRIYKHMQYEDARKYEKGASGDECTHCKEPQDSHECRFSGLYCKKEVTY